jgi:hypothetical protein
MAGAASAHQAATATHEETSHQRAVRTRRTSTDLQPAQQGATAAPAAAPAALDSLSRLQQLADASPQVAQLRRLQELADSRFAPVAQLAGDPEEEELVQGKFAIAQLQPQLQQAPRANNTGLPDQLKSGIESLSGLSMDDVRVHYNSSQPAQLNALAYAQGNDIHLAPGQERHLPHEAWHVVQQVQGRVMPTMQMAGGLAVNDDAELEREADVMGGKALEERTAVQARSPAADQLNDSPRQAAQRQMLDAAFGSATLGAQQAPVQRTVRGETPAKWSERKSNRQLVRNKLRAFADVAHREDLIFEASELDSYFEKELDGLLHNQMGDAESMYDDFRHHVAMIRDTEGAHGHERHAGTGDQFIVDRVNGLRAPPRASYLLMDEYLKWDSVLKTAEVDIYNQYLEGADEAIVELAASFETDEVANAAEGNTMLSDPKNYTQHARVEMRFANQNWRLQLATYINQRSLVDAEDNLLSVRIGASITGNRELAGRAVDRNGGWATLRDVEDITKKPEAHTGGLAPTFTLDRSIRKTADPAGGRSDLNWVTKF